MSRLQTQLPNAESALQMPYLQTAQEAPPGPGPWEQLSQVLRGVGQVASQAIDLKADMTIQEARTIASQQESEARYRSEVDRNRRATAKQELSELRLQYAGNDEGFLKAAPTLLQKYAEDPSIQSDILDSMTPSRESVLKDRERNADRLLQAKRGAFIGGYVFQQKDALYGNPEALSSATSDPVAFMDQMVRNATTDAERRGLISDETERAAFMADTYEKMQTAFGNDLLKRNRDISEESTKAEWAVTSDALLDSLTADNVTQTFDVIRQNRQALGDPPAVAQIAASKAIEDNITRIRSEDPVTTMVQRMRALDKVDAMNKRTGTNEAFVGNIDKLRQQIEADFRRESKEKTDSVVGRIVGATQTAAYGALGRPVSENEALALYATGNENAVGQMVDTIIPPSEDPVVVQERRSLAASITDRIFRGLDEQSKMKTVVDENEVEFGKLLSGIPGADVDKAYKASHIFGLMNGVPGSDSQEYQARAAAEMVYLTRGPKLPTDLVNDLNAGLASPNKDARRAALGLVKAMPKSVHYSAFTQLAEQNSSVAVAAHATMVAQGTGKVADDLDFFDQYVSAFRGAGEFLKNPLSVNAEDARGQALVKVLKKSPTLNLSNEDFVDPSSGALWKGLVLFNANNPAFAGAYGNDLDAIAQATSDTLPSWGLKWVRNGNTVALLKDSVGRVPDWIADQTRTDAAVRNWVTKNPEALLKVLDEDRLKRAELMSVRDGVTVDKALQTMDRPYAKGNTLNPDFVRQMRFAPIWDSMQLSMPIGSPDGGIPFRAWYGSQQIDTFSDDSPYSAITIDRLSESDPPASPPPPPRFRGGSKLPL